LVLGHSNHIVDRNRLRFEIKVAHRESHELKGIAGEISGIKNGEPRIFAQLPYV
jgi:hypothetical protein